jgi:prolyl oligopeptidase
MSVGFNSFPPVEEEIHGIAIRDDYRWLEDRSLPETEQWIETQKHRCGIYFADCDALAPLRNRVKSLLSAQVVDQPQRIGKRYFYRCRQRDQEQACIYFRDVETGEERLLVDPTGEGAFTSAGIHCIADDASLVAFEVKHDGGDTKEIRIVDVETGSVLSDRIPNGYARGFAFANGNRGFYFCHELLAQSPHHLIQFHTFSSAAPDRVVFRCERTRQSRLTLIADSVHIGAKYLHERGQELVCDLMIASRDRDEDWQPVFTNKEPPYTPILHRGRVFVFCCEGAVNGKIVEVSLDGMELQTVVPEQDVAHAQIVIEGERIYASYFKHGRSSIRSWTLAGEDRGEIAISAEGTCALLPRHGNHEIGLFHIHESFAERPSIFEHRPESGRSCLWNGHLPSQEAQGLGCQMSSLSFVARDGMEIPITLVARTRSNGSTIRPAIMTSYGGFGVSMTPRFSVLATIMMELGAVFALPQVRGGGEHGKSWHDAGRGRRRQTSIDDFISAAEWLCAEKITAPSQLAILGGSNSGLLVGCAMTQRPDLFRAALCIAPLLDMVRYEHFDRAARWREEYGTAEDAEDFRALYAYSPYHHVLKSVNYPATLFVSGDCDDRCNPAHVRKMAARLQERAAQSNAILVDYSRERGHSPVLPLSVRIDALARRVAFLCRELGIDVTPGGAQ